jgi:hypothetical protein
MEEFKKPKGKKKEFMNIQVQYFNDKIGSIISP